MVLGWILIGVGIAFVLLGLVAAAREVLRAQTEGVRGSSVDPESWAKLLSALTELIKVAPQWLLLVGVGLAMVVIGSGRI